MTRTATRRPRKYYIGKRRVPVYEPGWAVNDGVTLFGMFFSRRNAERTRDLLNASPRATRKQK